MSLSRAIKRSKYGPTLQSTTEQRISLGLSTQVHWSMRPYLFFVFVFLTDGVCQAPRELRRSQKGVYESGQIPTRLARNALGGLAFFRT
jgi:hypothetical protein